MASADYITFVDSDDKLDPEFIEATYNEMVKNDVDIVKTAFAFGFDKQISYSQNLNFSRSSNKKSILNQRMFIIFK